MGFNRATMPTMRQISVMLEPRRLPTDTPMLPFNTEDMETASSGRDVVTEIMRKPITNSSSLVNRAKLTAL